MTPPENDVLQAVAIVLFAICLAYAAGRMHQWYLQAMERDQAWRHGYDLAARSLFHLATRVRPAPVRKPEPTTKAEAVRATATVLRLTEETGRHTAVRSDTERMTAPRLLGPVAAFEDATVTGLVQQRMPAAG
jgi:hypothetical protein